MELTDRTSSLLQAVFPLSAKKNAKNLNNFLAFFHKSFTIAKWRFDL